MSQVIHSLKITDAEQIKSIRINKVNRAFDIQWQVELLKTY
jgi:hypothetical protein